MSLGPTSAARRTIGTALAVLLVLALPLGGLPVCCCLLGGCDCCQPPGAADAGAETAPCCACEAGPHAEEPSAGPESGCSCARALRSLPVFAPADDPVPKAGSAATTGLAEAAQESAAVRAAARPAVPPAPPPRLPVPLRL